MVTEKSDVEVRDREAFQLGLVGLGIWPLCLLPNLMSFAGHRGPDRVLSLAEYIFATFLWGSTLYPVVWLTSIALAKLSQWRNWDRAARLFNWLPVGYFLLMIGLIATAMFLE